MLSRRTFHLLTYSPDFDPDSPLFMKRHRSQILISNIGILVVIAALATWVRYRGFGEVARYYILPYLVVNHHLVMYVNLMLLPKGVDLEINLKY